MRRNVAGQFVGAQMITAADGTAFTGSVTVYVTGDAGTQAVGSVGSGACTHEGNGFHSYAPAQAETNYTHVAYTFIGTGAIPATVQIYPTAYDANGRADLGAISGSAVSTTTAQLGVNVVQISADATAADNAEAFFDGTGYAGTNNVIPTVTNVTNLHASAATAAALATVDSNVDAILVDTGTTLPGVLGTPAGADMSADIAAIKAETASIVADTNELQGDWANGGRLDLIIDDILVDTGTSLPALISAIPVLTPSTRIASTTIGTVNSQTNFTLSAGPDEDDILNGSMIIITSILDSDNKYPVEVTDFVGSTRTVTIAAAPPFTLAGSETVSVWGDIYTGPTAAEINAEVVDALSTDTYAEPTGVPGATVSLAEKIGRLYMALRNQVTVTATKKTYFDDSGSAEWEKDLSDDGTTYTESEGNAI